MRHGDKAAIVLVAAKEDLLNNLRDALADTKLALLHARSKQAAIALLERLKSEIDLAIIELELPDSEGWELIRRLTCPTPKPFKIIAATSTDLEPILEKAKELGVEALVPKTIPQEAWRKTVEAVLLKNENGD
jgi:CheY-like chemotaxis protein